MSKQNRRMTFETRGKAIKQTGLSYLGGVSLSQKMEKSVKKNVLTYIIYLAPANMSGYNVCPRASVECKQACLSGSGHNRIDIHGRIDRARIKKTKLFFENREYFNAWLFAEISANKIKAERMGMGFAVRLNGTSDITPTLFMHGGKTIFELFTNINFYDYTKVSNRFKLVKQFNNYDLTFSYSGRNWLECELALDKGVRVAVVFENKLPKTYRGVPVINGDLSDLRYLDGVNVIVGLKFKKVKNMVDLSKNKFIVPFNDKDCVY